MRALTRQRVRLLVVVMGWSLLAFGGETPAGAAAPNVTTMSTGGNHVCAVRMDRTVWCWGSARDGLLGDGTTGDADNLRTRPVRVMRGSSALTGVTRVAAGGSFTCAVRANGTVWCWGSITFGQLGNGVRGDIGDYRATAVQVRRGSVHLTGVKHVVAGRLHACALRTDGSVYCWGFAQYEQPGDGTTGGPGQVRTTAVRVRRGSAYLDKVTAIAAGTDHTCAIRKDGSTWCWGRGVDGQLGDGQSGGSHMRTVPVRVKRGNGYLTKAAGIDAGGDHTCVRRTDGTAWCWGAAESGQLGDGTTGDPVTHLRSTPVQVVRGSGVMTGVTGLGTGEGHSCARRSDGSAWCWGRGDSGQLGDGATGNPTTHVRLKPVRVLRPTEVLTGVRTVAGGFGHTCALRTDKGVWCWGSNRFGQAGRGSHDLDQHPYPRKVTFR